MKNGLNSNDNITPRSQMVNVFFCIIHKSCKRALLSQLIEFKHTILLHELYNEHQPVTDWIELKTNQILTSRQTHFKITKNKHI